MSQKYWISLIIIASITMACGSSEAKRNRRRAQNNRNCPQRLSGTWQFGAAPFSCGFPQEHAAPLRDRYNEVTFDDNASKDAERVRYMREMHKYINETATAYLQRREPQASAVDVEGWIQLVLATAHQESYFSHYRLGRDQLFRFFKGDHDHGHGMMQIDNRSHGVFINSGKVYDLQRHMVYAMDILYDGRQKSIRSPCSSNPVNIETVNRSAYSAYNGGPASRCRWTNPGHRWARNDQQFWVKHQQKDWSRFISSTVETRAETSSLAAPRMESYPSTPPQRAPLPRPRPTQNRRPVIDDYSIHRDSLKGDVV
ncbi:MAG: hypothetical protein K2Q26_08820 [Bdellovibrionales bacterium]|nr:hypothetical protein [Bdellovibrionales bacterium]